MFTFFCCTILKYLIESFRTVICSTNVNKIFDECLDKCPNHIMTSCAFPAGNFLACHPDDIAAVITTVATGPTELAAACPPSTNQPNLGAMTSGTRPIHERKIDVADGMPAKVSITPTSTNPTHSPSNTGETQLWGAFTVLVQRSMTIGPLHSKVAPLMANTAKKLSSKIPRAPLETCARATNVIGRATCDCACQFLEGLVTPEGECQGCVLGHASSRLLACHKPEFTHARTHAHIHMHTPTYTCSYTHGSAIPSHIRTIPLLLLPLRLLPGPIPPNPHRDLSLHRRCCFNRTHPHRTQRGPTNARS